MDLTTEYVRIWKDSITYSDLTVDEGDLSFKRRLGRYAQDIEVVLWF